MGINLTNYTISEPKSIPVILLLDTSASMSGEKIEKLNRAVEIMIDEFKKAQTMEKFIKLAIITFGNNGVKLHIPLTEVNNVDFKPLEAGGMTPMGTALKMAKDIIEDRNIIKSRDYRPAVVLVSDGQPNDEWEEPLEKFVSEGRTKKCDRLALAIGKDVDMDVLNLFIKDCDNPVFFSEDAKDIINKFKQITMTVTLRTKSSNPNQTIKIENTLDRDEIEDDIDDFEF
jgi:uncharacterized protein YegL